MSSALLRRNSIQQFLCATCPHKIPSRSHSFQKTLTRASSSSQSSASSSKDVLSSTHAPLAFVTQTNFIAVDEGSSTSGDNACRQQDKNQLKKRNRRRVKEDHRVYIEPVIEPSLLRASGKTYTTSLGPLTTPEQGESLLTHMQVSSTEPTLADLQTFRPLDIPQLRSFQYAALYNSVREQILNSFTKAQMRSFEELYVQGFISPSKAKMRIAEDIMEKAWGMPSPSKVERELKEQTELKSASEWANTSLFLPVLLICASQHYLFRLRSYSFFLEKVRDLNIWFVLTCSNQSRWIRTLTPCHRAWGSCFCVL